MLGKVAVRPRDRNGIWSGKDSRTSSQDAIGKAKAQKRETNRKLTNYQHFANRPLIRIAHN